jgi:hypothetical protein
VIRTLAAMGLGCVLLSSGCTFWIEFYTTGKGGSGDTGGTGGMGGSGGTGGAPFCSPGEKRACYTGPEGTEGQGICQAGEQTCNADGTAFGACEGEQLPQAENCATPLDEDCNGLAPSCGGQHLWSKRFGDALDQYGTGIAFDAAGDVLVTGYFGGVMAFGGDPLVASGETDLFEAKLFGDGTDAWSYRYGSGQGPYSRAIAAEPSGASIIAGSFGGPVDFGGGTVTPTAGLDAFLVKFDQSSAHQWSKRFGEGSGDLSVQLASAVAVDTLGNVIVAGSFYGSVDLGGGPLVSAGGRDVFVAKLDATGGHVWSRQFGDDAEQVAGGLTVDPNGDVIFTGLFGGDVDFGGGLISSTGNSIFVCKLDNAGQYVWASSHGNAYTEPSIATDSAGNVVVAGAFTDSVDFGGGPLAGKGGEDAFLARITGAGQHLWSKAFGGAGDERVSAVSVDSAGNAIVTGQFTKEINFGGGPLASLGDTDIFVAKFGALGDHQWSQRFGDKAAQQVSSVSVDSQGNAAITGWFFGAVDFGGGPLVSAGGRDVFVAAFGP